MIYRTVCPKSLAAPSPHPPQIPSHYPLTESATAMSSLLENREIYLIIVKINISNYLEVGTDVTIMQMGLTFQFFLNVMIHECHLNNVEYSFKSKIIL